MSEPPNERAFAFLKQIADDLSSGDITFPTFLDATLQVRLALKNPNLTAEELARVVSAEPLISLRLLRLANSAALNPGGKEVSDVRNAVIRVGFNQVRALAIAVAMAQLQKSREMAPYMEFAKQLWEHSIHVAAIAYVIARKCTRLNADEAMLAGLVHDIGQFYLLYRAAQFPGAAESPQDLAALMMEWHAPVGHALLSSLAAPEHILEAVDRHECFSGQLPLRALSDTVFVANRLSSVDNPFAELDASQIASQQAAAALADPQFAAVVAESQQELQSLHAALRG